MYGEQERGRGRKGEEDIARNLEYSPTSATGRGDSLYIVVACVYVCIYVCMYLMDE